MTKAGTPRKIWKLRSAILRCPTCKAYIVAEFVGEWRFRHPTKHERMIVGIDSAPSQEVLSSARTRVEAMEAKE